MSVIVYTRVSARMSVVANFGASLRAAANTSMATCKGTI